MSASEPTQIASREDETSSPLVPDPTIPGPSARHYPALDGIRGLAVLWVMVFHGFIPIGDKADSGPLMKIPAAGWLGVDIFFVLSGFLITGILLDTRNSLGYFRNFYARRFLRILPAYYLLLAGVLLVLPWFVSFDAPQLQTILRRQAWLWTYLTNVSYVYYRGAWTSFEWLVLDHLWSLAVEEQFYLVWPIVVCCLSLRWLKATAIACIVLSLGLRIAAWQFGMRPGAIYFPTPCRLDGLSFGALLAISIRDGASIRAIVRPCRTIGLVAICLLAALVWRRDGLPFGDREVMALAPTFVGLLAVSMIGLTLEPGANSALCKLLTNPVLRSTGKYSYGLYLYNCVLQNPLLVWCNWVSGCQLTSRLYSQSAAAMYLAVFFGASSLLAFISWHALEKQVLKLKPWFDCRSKPAPQLAKYPPALNESQS